MKTLLFVFLLALVSIGGLSSCKNCYACTQGSSEDVICRKDYPTEQAFQSEYQLLTNAGYTCE